MMLLAWEKCKKYLKKNNYSKGALKINIVDNIIFRKLSYSLMLYLLFASPVSAVEIRENPLAWTCYDISVNFERENPEWDCVTIGTDPYFKRNSHMANYQIDGDNLEIYDGFYLIAYTIPDYKNTSNFYHFWHESTPVRNYKFLRDNS